MESAESARLSFIDQVKALPWPFWVANIMEMIERLAYYGVRVVIPIYIAQADEPGGLHFSQADKGMIFMAWALIQSLLPVFTGGFADRYGYKKQIVIAIALKAVGYVGMATQREFWPFFFSCMLLAAGTAVFKPPVQGTFVKTLDERNSGVGWGFFYMVVNIGGFLGPPLAHFLYGYSWAMVFYGCAVLVSLNLLWLFTYESPASGADTSTSVLDVAWLTLKNIFQWKLLLFIGIMSFFWAGFTQLFDMMPNFIVDWVDSSAIAGSLPEFMRAADTSRGPQIAQEWMINLNPFLIVIFVVPISWLVNNLMRRLTSIAVGMLVAGLGVALAGATPLWSFCLLGIALFSLGEMLSSPKMSEYLGVIAPEDKKALYMGYSNIPFAIGWTYGAFAGGDLYGRLGEKATLAMRYLGEELQVVGEIPRNEAFSMLLEKTGWSAAEATTKLWELYSPGQVWTPFAIGIGVAVVMLVVYNRFASRWEGANA
ncbi:MAG: MFS transporter [Deltaproteobacteria bacterium]|nr:MFS transporter [Deltaproteobacteria bacterium]